LGALVLGAALLPAGAALILLWLNESLLVRALVLAAATVAGLAGAIALMVLVRRIERERADAIDRAKSVFLATISHEIRTPMNAVIGMADLLRQTKLSNTQSSYLSKLISASKHLLGIINDILDLSKIEASKLDLEHVPFVLDDVLDGVASMVGVRAAEKNVELIIERAPNVPVALVGDPLRLGQILTNLAGNAVKFTHEGEVRLSVHDEGMVGDKAFLCFQIRDTGIGISKEQQARLFRPFTQADESTTRRYGGTGLGLAICRRLVDLKGGSIGLDSEPGRGSTFRVLVPMQVRTDTRRQVPGVPPAIRGRRVLVLEPNETACTAMVQALRSAGLNAHGFTHADKAQVHLFGEGGHTPPDVALLNWRLPDGSLRDILGRARKKNVNWRALVLATHGDADEAQAWLASLGLGALLIKPASPSSLFEAVARSLDAEQRMRANMSLRASDRMSGEFLVPGERGFAWAQLAGRRVLLVEDNPINQEVVVALLRRVGVAADVTADGREALALVQAKRASGGAYDAVLMDRHMPGMDGLETTRLIRSDSGCAALPIIALTADVVGGAREECLEAGMNDFLSKPFVPEALYETLNRVIQPGSSPVPVMNAFNVTSSNLVVVGEPEIPLEIPGVDTGQGLLHVNGNQSLYVSLLRGFHQDHRHDDRHLTALLRDGEVKEAIRLMHTVKGLSGTMGARSLQRLAAQIEQALKTGAPVPASMQEAFARELRQVSDGIAPLGRANPHAITKTSTNARGILDRVSTLVKECDPTADSCAEQLLVALNGAAQIEAGRLLARLRVYDFQGANDVLNELHRLVPAQAIEVSHEASA
jgi:signal transduction histidine kinase/DNA-binding response OmpR family regulator/HPt (histidine-containing phosphotransfer) domain-containing protein